jgi:hypothetical protein
VDVTPDEPLGETGNDHLAESTRVGPAASTPTPQTRPDWASLLVSLLPFADRYLKLQEGKQNHEQAIERVQAESGWRVLAIMMAFLAGVIAVMSWLTFAGKVSGDALLFLVGTVAGYTLAIVQRHLFPETVEVNSDS